MDITVLDAPSNLGLRPGPGGRISGVDRLAATVRAAGLLDRLRDAGVGSVTDGGVVEAAAYDLGDWKVGEPFNARRIEEFTIRLADRLVSIRPSAYSAGRTVVLGGDCSILLGPLLALKRRGTPGLVFIDAHSDFRHQNVDAAAGEELAIATGRGGHFLTDLEGRGPLLRDEDVVMIGVREPDDVPFRQATTAAEALEYLTTDDIWVHVDADILDPSYLPAVDSPEPGGLSPDELVAILRPLLADERVRGMDLCIYDPALDSPELPGATLLADILGRAFSH